MSDESDNVQTALNKSDITHLENKVDNLEDKVNDTPSQEDFKQLETTIKKVLLEGNGDKPLTIKVAKNRNMIKNLNGKFNRAWAAIGSLFGFIGGISAKIFTGWF